jgi:hypothetical protein
MYLVAGAQAPNTIRQAAAVMVYFIRQSAAGGGMGDLNGLTLRGGLMFHSGVSVQG